MRFSMTATLVLANLSSAVGAMHVDSSSETPDYSFESATEDWEFNSDAASSVWEDSPAFFVEPASKIDFNNPRQALRFWNQHDHAWRLVHVGTGHDFALRSNPDLEPGEISTASMSYYGEGGSLSFALNYQSSDGGELRFFINDQLLINKQDSEADADRLYRFQIPKDQRITLRWVFVAGQSGGMARLDNIELTGTLDSDQDGLPDPWEFKHMEDLFSFAGIDNDQDGLSNLQEYQLGSNPVVADTDGDGASDGWEVDHYLDPNQPDREAKDVLSKFKAMAYLEIAAQAKASQRLDEALRYTKIAAQLGNKVAQTDLAQLYRLQDTELGYEAARLWTRIAAATSAEDYQNIANDFVDDFKEIQNIYSVTYHRRGLQDLQEALDYAFQQGHPSSASQPSPRTLVNKSR
jgi:hypothetical protein